MILRSSELGPGKNVIRPSIPHLVGAYGAALIAKKKKTTASSLLKKEDINSFTHSLKAFHYALCTNHYNLTVNAPMDEAKHIAGNRCERPVTGKVNKEKLSNLYDYKHDELLKPKGVSGAQGEIGTPPVLNLYDNPPFWHSFFTSLGHEVILSDRSSKALYSLGQHTIPSDAICCPAKLAHGHIQSFTGKGLRTISYLCMAYNVNEDTRDNHFNRPAVAYYPGVVEGNVNLEHIKLLYPYIYLEDKHIFGQKMLEYFKARQMDASFKLSPIYISEPTRP